MRKSLSYISIVSRADTMCSRAVKASIAFCIAWEDAFKKLDDFFVFGLAVHSILGDKMLHSHTGTHLAKLKYLHLNWSLLGTVQRKVMSAGQLSLKYLLKYIR